MDTRRRDSVHGFPANRYRRAVPDGAERRRLAGFVAARHARRVNEYTASVVAKRPDRFGNFVALPLPDVEGALELERAFRDLKADGVILLSNYEGCYLGDSAFEELWKEFDRRKAAPSCILASQSSRSSPNLSNFVPALRAMIMLPGCGHWTQQERVAEVNAAMIEFLQGL
jgi:pimeloyl-ACP methyl ester carboxylesterase